VGNEPQEDQRSAAKLLLAQWASDWESKQLESYFSAYDHSVSPDQRFSTFEKWATYKRRVIANHADIEVTTSEFVQEIIEDGKRVRLTFDQHFKSDKTDDMDRKTIVMHMIDGQWKIVSESTVQPL
jgi:hypothetical protein